MILTGNIGKFGTGCHTWSGNYKVGIWQAAPWSGAGAGVYLGEDPWNLNLDQDSHGKEINTGNTIMARSRGTGTTATTR